MAKTHWKKVVSDPNFIGEGDFQEGEEKIVTIAKVNASETVTTQEGKSKKAVVHFAEQNVKPMILNVARSKSIEKVAKSPYFEDWVGVKIQLYIEHGIKAFGEVVSAVRVRPFKPKGIVLVKCDKCGSDIKPGHGMTSEQMADYTRKKYGAALCANCAVEANKAMQNAQNDQAQNDMAEHEKANTNGSAENGGISNETVENANE